MHRHLTTTERVFLAMAERVVMNPVVMVRCRGALSIERVEHAVRTVQRRHPALQVRVVRDSRPRAADSDSRPWFTDRDVGPVSVRVVERRSAEHWREVVRDELNLRFDIERGPLIRFVLVRDEHACELICTTDHVNADGRSGLFVLRDVLRVIDRPELRLVPLRERTCFDDYLPTSAFDMRLPDSLRGLWAERTRSLIARVERVGDRLLERELEPAIARAPIEFVHRRLDPERTAALEQACRARDNTVLSALAVACAHALIGVERADAKGVIGCITPIDIRPLLKPSVGDDFGIYAWAPTSYHPIGPDSDFWALAQRMRRIVRAYRSLPALAGMRRLIDAMEFTEGTALASSYDKLMRVALDGMMVVSNLGRVTLPERVAGVEVESFGFFAMIPNVEFVMGVQSFRGVLEMNYCCSRQWMRPSVIEGVADRVEAVLDAAIGGEARGAARRLRFG
ncbi:phthiocerol/phthiodiolone dimycocerosyl transferase family protein [Nannocystaceae bacterium ST9]